MLFLKFNIVLLGIFIFSSLGVSQNSNGHETDLKKLEDIGDKLGEKAIILNLKLDTLRKEIDSLKNYSILLGTELIKFKKEILEIIGHTSESLIEFRRKFDETEMKINNKSGTPDDAKKMYFDEITNDKARCLPEFSDRYASMSKKLIPWCCSDEIKAHTINTSNTYEVKYGDCLKMIAKKLLGKEKFWKQIWNANKNGVANQDDVQKNMQKLTNPNLIYPGQFLNIPQITK
jgi:nucleoid-associated protein YgaU